MISYLSGQPIQIFSDRVIILTQSGIGFQVFVSPSFLSKIDPTLHKEMQIYIHSYIREDRFELYGLPTAEELKLFELLITVSGLGPKTALNMFGEAGAGQIIQAVQNADLNFFSSVPRVGKKLAQKIIIELKTKLGGLGELDLAPKSQQYQDIKDSLLRLGYTENEIDRTLTQIDFESITLPAAIKLAIKNIAQQH